VLAALAFVLGLKRSRPACCGAGGFLTTLPPCPPSPPKVRPGGRISLGGTPCSHYPVTGFHSNFGSSKTFAVSSLTKALVGLIWQKYFATGLADGFALLSLVSEGAAPPILESGPVVVGRSGRPRPASGPRAAVRGPIGHRRDGRWAVSGPDGHGVAGAVVRLEDDRGSQRCRFRR